MNAVDKKGPEHSEEETEANSAQSLFIIKANNHSLKAAENFLKNRGWEVGSAVNMREALAYIIQKNPTYVMIAADHPNRKVRLLPKLLAQAFPVKIIGFAENSSSASMGALNEMKLEYVLYPPVSGPMIDRLIRKMIRDEELRDAEMQERATKGTLTQEEEQLLKFKTQAADGNQVQVFESARNALSQFVNSESDHGSGSDITGVHGGSGVNSSQGYGGMGGSSPNSDPNTAYTQGSQSNTHEQSNNSGSGVNDPGGYGGMGGFSQTGDGDSNYGGMGGTRGGQPGDSSSGNNANQGPGYFPHQQKAGEGIGAAYTPEEIKKAKKRNQYGSSGGGSTRSNESATEEGPGLGETYEQWEERMRKALGKRKNDSGENQNDDDDSIDPHKPNLKKNYAPIEYGKEQDPEGQPQYTDSKDDEPSSTTEDEVKTKNANEIRIRSEGFNRSNTESIIVRGTQQALDESVTLTSGPAAHVEQSSNVACIVVDSPKFKGYLVAALGKNRKIDKEFIEGIRMRLFKFLKENGETVSDEDSMSIKIKQVEFEDWALEQAEFLKKSVHNGDEVAMAFFPAQSTEQKFDESRSEKMVALSLEELKPDTPVEFDLYVFLPENNKYILYTPQGRTFYGAQKDRLVQKGVTHMHLRKDSVQDVKRYKAQNYLNSKIEEYRNKKSSKSP